MKKAAPPSILVVVILLAVAVIAEARPAAKVPRIGVLLVGSAGGSGLEAFRQGLHDLNYIEGKNIIVEYRFAKGNPERIPDLAADLIHKKVDVIITGVRPKPELSRN